MRGKWVIQVGLASTSPAYIKAWHAVQGCFGVSRTSVMFENIRQKWNEFSWSQNWEDSEWLLGQPPVTSNCGWSNEETDHPLRLCSIVNPLSFSWSQGIWSKNNFTYSLSPSRFYLYCSIRRRRAFMKAISSIRSASRCLNEIVHQRENLFKIIIPPL